jgi:hypothetical protein
MQLARQPGYLGRSSVKDTEAKEIAMIRGLNSACRALLAFAVLYPGLAFAQKPDKNQQSAPKVVVILKKGESTCLHLCWDDGTGRVPVVFLSGEAALDPDEDDWNGKPRYEQNGVTAEYDERQSAAVQAELYKSGYAGPQKDGKLKHATCAVVALRVASGADPGVHSVFIQIISGTGRNMRLAGEFRVLVQQ